jgi:hypothetical protein
MPNFLFLDTYKQLNAIIQELYFILSTPQLKYTPVPQDVIAYVILPIFRNYLVNVTIFRRNVFDAKYVFIFLTTCI